MHIHSCILRGSLSTEVINTMEINKLINVTHFDDVFPYAIHCEARIEELKQDVYKRQVYYWPGIGNTSVPRLPVAEN